MKDIEMKWNMRDKCFVSSSSFLFFSFDDLMVSMNDHLVSLSLYFEFSEVTKLLIE